MADYRIISLGTLASNPLWNEPADIRTGHATTVLIESGDERIVINPGLPARALQQRMAERTNLRPTDITQVFLTCGLIDHRRGMSLFENAKWLIHEPERDLAVAHANEQLADARAGGDGDLVAFHDHDLKMLSRTHAAEDSLADHIDLFPLPGVTPGTCGILIAQPRATILATGDAIPTVEHLEQGKILPDSADFEAAQESFQEAVEIADVLILGRDNIVTNPLRGQMRSSGVQM